MIPLAYRDLNLTEADAKDFALKYLRLNLGAIRDDPEIEAITDRLIASIVGEIRSRLPFFLRWLPIEPVTDVLDDLIPDKLVDLIEPYLARL